MQTQSKQEQVIEGNRIIADFMGVKIGEDKYSWRPGYTEPLQESHLDYHKEWGWLMPVVEKILQLGAYYKLRNSWGSRSDRELVFISEITMYDMDGHEVIYENQSHDYEQINAVYSAVVQFIHWYNSLNK